MRDSLKHKLENLLKDTPEAYYWVGFILADGYLSDNNRLKITVSNIDLVLLKSFCNFIELDYTKIATQHRDGKIYNTVAVMNTPIIKELKSKFDLKKRKTYNPPLKVFKPDKLLMSLYCGFIDGDGNISKLQNRPDVALQIKLHSSWLSFLITMKMNLYSYFKSTKTFKGNIPKLNTAGYALSTISNNLLLKNLKKFAIRQKLPVLKRKWDKVNLNYINRYEIAAKRRILIYKYLEQGLPYKEIAKKLKVGYSTVSQTILRDKYKRDTNATI